MADLRIVDAPVLLQESITDDVKMPTGGLGNFSVRLGDIVWYVVTKEQLANKNYVDLSSKGVKDSLDEHVANKANPHQVTKAQVGLGNVDNTADVDKPISTSAESALSTKANKVDVYTKDETTGLINGIVTSNVSGHRGYLTLADVQAAQASLTSNTVVEVLADTDTSKNGTYLWDGTTLKKSTYDVLTTAKKYVNSNVKSLVGITNGINIADLSKVENGKYVDYTSGVRYPNASYSVLGMYAVEQNTEYKVAKEGTQQFAFYDINKNYISGKATPDAGQIFTTPSEAYFVAFTVKTSDIGNFMLAKSSEYPTAFTPYFTNVKGLKINTNQISDLISTVKNELGFYTINIVDTSKIKANTYVAFSDGIEYANSAYVVAGAYEIKPNTEYQVSDWYILQVAFYDANNVYISGISAIDSTHKFVTPNNAKYIKLTVRNGTIQDLMVAESAIFPSNYVAYGQSIKDLIVAKDETYNTLTPIFQPILKAVNNGLTIDLTGTVINQIGKSTTLTKQFILDATTSGTATVTSTLNRTIYQSWAQNPNPWLGYVNLANVVVTDTATNSQLVKGTHYDIDAVGGKLIGLTATAYNVSVTFTYSNERYDLIQINPFTLGVSVVKGVERVRDTGEWMPEPVAPNRALCRVLVAGTYTEIVPLDEYMTVGGKPYLFKDDLDAVQKHNASCLKRVIAKLNKGQNITLVGYGDSITAIGGFHNQEIPNENHDYFGFYADYPQDMRDRIPTYQYDSGGGGRLHVGWNWQLKAHLEQVYKNTVNYYNFGVSGTDSASGASDTRLSYPLAYNPDIVVVAFGMNDAGSPNLYPSLVKIVNTFKNAGADVVLMPVVRTPTLIGTGYQLDDWRKVNRMIYSAAIDSGAVYVPIDWYADDTHFGGMGISPRHLCSQNRFNHPGPYEYGIYSKILISCFE